MKEKEIILILILFLVSIISFLLHVRERRKVKLSFSGSRHLKTLTIFDDLSDISSYLPENLSHLYKDDLLVVSNSARHTLIACNHIIYEIGKLYYPNYSFTISELADELLKDRWITQDMFVWIMDFENVMDNPQLINKIKIQESASEIKELICFLLQMLYVTPNKILALRKK